MKTQSSKNAQETFELGKKISQHIQPPTVVLLYGELGSGKTVLVRGLADGLGVTDLDLVRSPSYTLVNEYQTNDSVIYHLDLYRLDNLLDLYSIGLDEILASGSITIVEWAEKLYLEVQHPFPIHIEVNQSTGVRTFEIG